MTEFRPDGLRRLGDPQADYFRPDTTARPVGATNTQVGGDHYRDMPIQPIEYVLRNGLGYAEGNVVKYVSRWRSKGGIEDLRKARHYLDMLIDHEMEAGPDR